jgi:polyisoprenoid-binding protein YceI
MHRRRTGPKVAPRPERAAAGRAGGIAAILAALLLAPGTAAAAPRCYAVDSASSRVDFRIRLFGLFSPGGRFRRVAGTVVFDPDHWDALAVSVRISVGDMESRPRFWRDELLGPRFFDHARYPQISFAATRAEQTAPSAGLAYGEVTLRGTTRPVVLRARLQPSDEALEIEADTALKRSDFGLGGVLPLASDEVTIALSLHTTPGDCEGERRAPSEL